MAAATTAMTAALDAGDVDRVVLDTRYLSGGALAVPGPELAHH
jgi:hypothetical protein